ncbi:MAG: hypothetical protein WCX34_07995, partial [Syntrophales bacterium]
YGTKTNESQVLINYINMLSLHNRKFIATNPDHGKNGGPSCAKVSSLRFLSRWRSFEMTHEGCDTPSK